MTKEGVTIFLTELHAHTKESSPCSKISSESLILNYKKLGYKTIVITDHYTDKLITTHNPSEVVDNFLEGYNKAVIAGKNNNINVLLGMEIRFKDEKEDYLIYGITRDFLIENYDICNFNIKKLRDTLNKSSLSYFISQAHPGRTSCKYPCQLDGIEVFNAMNHDSSMNLDAELFSQKFNLIPTSGTDCHSSDVIGKGGIISDNHIINNDDLVCILRNQLYSLKL